MNFHFADHKLCSLDMNPICYSSINPSVSFSGKKCQEVFPLFFLWVLLYDIWHIKNHLKLSTFIIHYFFIVVLLQILMELTVIYLHIKQIAFGIKSIHVLKNAVKADPTKRLWSLKDLPGKYDADTTKKWKILDFNPQNNIRISKSAFIV